jgi:hypothetical protein
MNKFKIYFFALITLLLSSCIEQDELLFEDSVVEFDASTWEAKSVVGGVAKNYLLLTRVPKYGWPTTTADPLIARTSGTVKLRVNLVGAQRSTAEEVTFKVVPEETTAIEGVHYTTTGKVTIPANSSFGELEVKILNPGTSSATPVNLVLQLDGNASLPASANYSRLGIQIRQI